MPASFRRPYPAYRVNAYAAAADKPMSELNTTPLIDVLLVLLVMLILTIPMATHVLEVDLPQDRSAPTLVEQVALTVSRSGQPSWNGEPVTRAQLEARLAQVALQEEQPLIRFEPHPQASYDASVQVIALVGEAGLTRFAFIGNERFRSFGK